MRLMPARSFLVAALSASLSSMNAPARCRSKGLKLMLTDSVALPARDLNSGSLRRASCAEAAAGMSKQANAIFTIRIFMSGLLWVAGGTSLGPCRKYERRASTGCMVCFVGLERIIPGHDRAGGPWGEVAMLSWQAMLLNGFF